MHRPRSSMLLAAALITVQLLAARGARAEPSSLAGREPGSREASVSGRRYAGRERYRTDYPIILAHGITPFDVGHKRLTRWLPAPIKRLLKVDSRNYFKDVASTLRREGFDVHTTQVSFAASASQRGRELGDEIARVLGETGADKVHIIGHSMGGLDARHFIVEEGNQVTVEGDELSDVVVSATSIGTPHNGTPFADFGLEHGGDEAIGALSGLVSFEGFRALPVEVAKAFNETHRRTEIENSVVYQVVGTRQDRDKVFWPLQLSWQIIHDAAGENDGLVPLSSQRWSGGLGEGKKVRDLSYLFPDGDHLNQIAWGHFRERGNGLLDVLTPRAWKERYAYEKKVRDAYVGIAESLIDIEDRAADRQPAHQRRR